MLKLPRNQQGISLVESMISLLVISIGLLGIASLQITAMRQNTSALNHSQAVWYANNMADRIRANSRVQFPLYNNINTANTSAQDCLTAACTNAQMRVADADDWATLIGSLPSGQGRITANAGVTELYITVMWDDDGTGATGTACGTDNTVDLTCYRVAIQ